VRSLDRASELETLPRAGTFAYLAIKPELHRPGLLVSIALYAPIVLHRTISLFRFGPVESMTKMVAGLEIVMLAIAVALWFLAQDRVID
jgi:hypothetical protein